MTTDPLMDAINNNPTLAILTPEDRHRFYLQQKEMRNLPPLTPLQQYAYERDRAIGDGNWDRLNEIEEGDREPLHCEDCTAPLDDCVCSEW